MESDSAGLDKINYKSVVGHLNSTDSSLRGLCHWVVTGEGVNVQENECVRYRSMHTYFGQPAFTLSFVRSCK